MNKSKKSIKVLLVEDDVDICEMYAATFMRAGFTVFTAHDGDSGIDKFKKKRPDVVLLDIMLPTVSGYEVLGMIRKDMRSYTPVIMLTNLNASHYAKHASFDAVDDYLIKSNFTPSEILEKTKDVLRLNKKL